MILVGLFLSFPVEAQTFRCPLSPQDNEGSSSFIGATLYDGPLGDRSASLAPDREKRRGKEVSQTWPIDLPRAQGQNIWVECRYKNTSNVISLNLPKGIRECRMILEMKKGEVVRATPMTCQ